MKKALLVLALVSARLLAEPRSQVHFKREVAGSGLPGVMTGETWVKGNRVRTVMDTPMGSSISIVKDNVVYVTMAGMAVKMSVDAQRKQRGLSPADYA